MTGWPSLQPAEVWSPGELQLPESRHCPCCSLRWGLWQLPGAALLTGSATGSLLAVAAACRRGWGSAEHCQFSLSPLSLKRDRIFQGPFASLCLELTPVLSCPGLVCAGWVLPALLPTHLPSFSCLPSGRVHPRMPVPGCMLEVTAWPFSWSLCWFSVCCEDESHRCHHVVLRRKGRAELLTVTGSTVLGTATRHRLLAGCGGAGALLSLVFLLPASQLAGVLRAASGDISGVPLGLERPASCPGCSQPRAPVVPSRLEKGLLPTVELPWPCLLPPLVPFSLPLSPCL